MINSLLSQLPPGTGVLCLALAAALGWCRASRWKSRYHELNRNIRSQAEENSYLREQFDRMWNDNDGVLGNAHKDSKEQIEFLRTRLTELTSPSADRLAIFERDLQNLRRQISNPPVAASPPLPEGFEYVTEPAASGSYGGPPPSLKESREALREVIHTQQHGSDSPSTKRYLQEDRFATIRPPSVQPPQPGAPDPGEGWRLLTDDEQIKAGDQCFNTEIGEWEASHRLNETPAQVAEILKTWQRPALFYRRRVQPAADLWASAPPWAMFRATDEDGSVWFFEKEPAVDENRHEWVVYQHCGCEHQPDEAACLPAPVANWRDTLIRRPVKSAETV